MMLISNSIVGIPTGSLAPFLYCPRAWIGLCRFGWRGSSGPSPPFLHEYWAFCFGFVGDLGHLYRVVTQVRSCLVVLGRWNSLLSFANSSWAVKAFAVPSHHFSTWVSPALRRFALCSPGRGCLGERWRKGAEIPVRDQRWMRHLVRRNSYGFWCSLRATCEYFSG